MPAAECRWNLFLQPPKSPWLLFKSLIQSLLPENWEHFISLPEHLGDKSLGSFQGRSQKGVNRKELLLASVNYFTGTDGAHSPSPCTGVDLSAAAEEEEVVLGQRDPAAMTEKPWESRGSMWGGRGSEEELLGTEHNPLVPVPLCCWWGTEELGVEDGEAEKLGVKGRRWAWEKEGVGGRWCIDLFSTIQTYCIWQ